ncbi:hypothetical protein TruAng_001604 [Truncatella angustata]|nr:hypothetical protein TruAng_001604 [Truncatella angustata]
MEIYVDQMRAWLRQWIKETQNGFIHGHLYSVTGLPHCLQNAWAALTAYFFKTRENEVATMSMIQARAEELIVQQSHNEICSATMSLLGTVEHLARVQALFVYQFIRLFDGNIRQRALAEKEIPVLFSWCRALWESATLHADSENFSLPSSPFDGADPIAHLWRKWVLSESIRRMWIITHFTQSVYFTMRDGWTNCPGGVCFTARQGLWDASSSDAWANLLGTHDPWFFSCAHANQLLMIAEPGRVDSFSELLLKMLWGNEKIENWMKNGSAVSNLTLD